jgi:hypothetical protein
MGAGGEQPGAAAGDAFAQASEAGTQPAASSNPVMFGDLIGVAGRRVIFAQPGVTLPAGFTRVHGGIASAVAPLPLRSAFKIAENESPRPQDRAYFNYNFYNNVDRTVIGAPSADLHRETIGFEKTLLSGDASVGLRLPFLQLRGDQSVEDSQVGDLSMIFKYALLNDRSTGNVLSTGMVLTVPTGQNLAIDGESTLHSTVFQPFVGYVYNMDRLYFQGFSSVAVPTDARDVTLLFNSFSLGYYAWRTTDSGAALRGLVPVIELHVNTPLSHRGTDSADPIAIADTVNLTGGLHVLLQRATLGVAAGLPLTGPKPYDFEVNVNLNYHF